MEEEKKIYIGNLEFSVTESDLAKALEEKNLNAKEIVVIMDKYSGRSKGFGFAEFETAEDTQKAIDALNGQEIKGRALKVNKAQKRKPRNDSFGGGGGGRGSRDRRY
ncbi:MAG: RNA-binding protein [Candidatus Omnitrophica bacterium]|nr:RNA-binding protein [Candidatus Omnitrophota bacterium]